VEWKISADLGVAEEGAREGDELLLAGAEGRAALRQHQVQARGCCLHHLRQVRPPQRRPTLGVCVLPEGRQVEAQRPREKHWHLIKTPERCSFFFMFTFPGLRKCSISRPRTGM
jgi:hypothetical protein